MTACVAEVYRDKITHRTPIADAVDKELTVYLYVAPDQCNGTGSQALREAALHTEADPGGEAWARVPFTLITKTSAISITFQWTLNVAGS